MCICSRLLSITTLLIGLQLFNPTLVKAKVVANLPDSISSSSAIGASNSRRLAGISQIIAQSNSTFTPPDKGGPENTQGASTR